MKKRGLVKHVRSHGCVLDRQGSDHEVWINPESKKESTIPRHREIKTGTAKAVCRQLGIPVITSL